MQPQDPQHKRPSLGRTCATVQAHFGLLDAFPQFRANQAEIETHTQQCLSRKVPATRPGVTTIPCVMHVVYHTAEENISEAQVRSQIDVLNQDFRATNPDLSKVPEPFQPLVQDARIEFALAARDPAGQPTSGITRTKSDRSSFAIDNGVKSVATGGVAVWDPDRYLNIWVCPLAARVLGYAQFPGGPPQTDGVVIRHSAMGTIGTVRAPFDKGRTLTHEIGHYLNLSHIWGESRFATCGDTDYVDDTPSQFGPNRGTPEFPRVSCDNGPYGDLFMNFMDYVDDAAMVMFTTLQVARMQATLTGPRQTLGTSDGGEDLPDVTA